MIEMRYPNPEKLYNYVEVVEFMLETVANAARALQQDAATRATRWTSLEIMRRELDQSVRETQRILERFREDHQL